MVWLWHAVLLVTALTAEFVKAQRDRDYSDCFESFNVTSGNPDPEDFTYATGETVTITFTFNCTISTTEKDDFEFPWRKPSRLRVYLDTHSGNLTDRKSLFSVRPRYPYERLSVLADDIGKYGIQVRYEFETQSKLIVIVEVANINATLNGSTMSWLSPPPYSVGKVGPFIVKCCTREVLPQRFRKSNTDGHQNCFKGLTIHCKEGTMFQKNSYLPSLDIKCSANSKWLYSSDLVCRDVATFDFSNKNQILKSGKRVVFVCDAANSQSVVLESGNETVLVKNTLKLTPEHNGMEASCRKLNGSGERAVEKRARLNVWYPPMLDEEYVGNFSLVEGSSSYVIIHFHANPRVDTKDGQVNLRGTRKQRLKNFYVTGVASDPLHKLIVNFIKVKKSDFGTYTLVARSPKFPQDPLYQKFTIGRAPSSRLSPTADNQSESATEGASVLVICLASILGVCFIAMVVLAVLYARNKYDQPKIPEETKDAGADNAGIYNEPDFGEYENLEVADRPAVSQEAEYVNSRL